ncbi:hypothetical protein PHYPO_G00054140 [Pangasianodon hypophthalmus]|uniref:Uncharacterized protein n=1 Tax=Pangasianodon hypophthalmus TaxID=310915 RepID=A0A5N5M7V3_PANHP|nr:hypothetical protein PHYPO_G00054140 [Pangasianodon hypophthalmus]
MHLILYLLHSTNNTSLVYLFSPATDCSCSLAYLVLNYDHAVLRCLRVLEKVWFLTLGYVTADSHLRQQAGNFIMRRNAVRGAPW